MGRLVKNNELLKFDKLHSSLDKPSKIKTGKSRAYLHKPILLRE